MSENMIGYIYVKLENLQLHPLVEEHEELLASLDYTMKSIKDFTSKAANLLLNLHPIFVVQKQPNVYLVFAGFRTYNIASRLVSASTEVRVLLVVNQPTDVLTSCIYADLYLTPLAFSLRHPAKDITDIQKIIPGKYARAFTPEMARNKSSLARVLGTSTSTIHYRRKKVGTHND